MSSEKNESLKGLNVILKNPIVKAVLMKQLKKLIEENKITLVTLKFNNGELEAIPYFEEMKILPKKDFDELIKSITE